MTRETGGTDYELNNLMLEQHTIDILKYLRNNQMHNTSITKGDLVRYMHEHRICSKPTTLKLIQRLLDHKIIINDKKKDTNSSRLLVNPSVDWRAIETDLLTTSIKEIGERFADFDDTGLANEILKTIPHHGKRRVQLREEPKQIRYSKKT